MRRFKNWLGTINCNVAAMICGLLLVTAVGVIVAGLLLAVMYLSISCWYVLAALGTAFIIWAVGWLVIFELGID